MPTSHIVGQMPGPHIVRQITLENFDSRSKYVLTHVPNNGELIIERTIDTTTPDHKPLQIKERIVFSIPEDIDSLVRGLRALSIIP